MADQKDTFTGAKGAERRQGERIAASRDVHFSDYHALGPLRTGSVTDISTGGFRIVTRNPEPAGTLIQIEMRPEADNTDGGVVLFEGKVAHVTQLEDGSSAMGILKTQRPLKQPVPVNLNVVSGRISSGVKSLAKSKGSNASAAPSVKSTTESVPSKKATFRRIGKEQNCPRERKWAKRFGFLLVAGLMGLFLLMLNRLAEDKPTYAALSGGGSAYEELAEKDLLENEKFSGPAGDMENHSGDGQYEETRLAALDYTASLEREIVGAFASLEKGDDLEAATALASLDKQPHGNPMKKIQALLQYAEEAERRGEMELAKMAIRKALKYEQDMSQAWQPYMSSLRQAIASTDNSLPQLSDPVWLEQSTTEFAGLPVVELEVDKKNFVLNIKRGGRVIRSFPVGLGRFDGTPSGQFVIVNKLQSPDWYNRGNVVPAGAPNNPLGDYWMGLGKGDRATSYGIHPTASSQSIGQPLSRGCVRMQPQDAEWLFRIAPIGTPVTIR